MNRYQWTVIGAAWLGWGFDAFEAVLFNLVATNCLSTLLGLSMATLVLILAWLCNGFGPLVFPMIAAASPEAASLSPPELEALKEKWKTAGLNWYNLGGLVGAILTVPCARLLGRRAMYALYLFGAAASLYVTFAVVKDPAVQLVLASALGLTIFGISGSFTFYLPELFPTRLRGAGAGICYSAGRVIAAGGPFMVGALSGNLPAILSILSQAAFVAPAGVLLACFIVETRHEVLPD